MHVTVASERLSLDNYATALSACGGAASSATTTSMHSIKPNDYDISCLKKNVQLPSIVQLEENHIYSHSAINANNYTNKKSKTRDKVN